MDSERDTRSVETQAQNGVFLLFKVLQLSYSSSAEYVQIV